MSNCRKLSIFLALIFSLIYSNQLQAQAIKKSNTSNTLQFEIAGMDSLLFVAFNNRDLDKMKTFFSTELELYQDNDGVKNYVQTIEGFKSLFSRDYILRREFIKGSLEVFPIKDFGAIQTGKHQFCHVENGKMECAIFKFLHIWEKTGEGWKIKRLITYDH